MRPISFASIACGLVLAALQATSWAADQAVPAGEKASAEAGQAAAQPEVMELAGFNPHNFQVPAGIYKCDLDRKVDVREVAKDLQTATVRWNKKDYTLRAVAARSGALRYEDTASGLVWLVIVGKSMLLDTKAGKQLANDCKI